MRTTRPALHGSRASWAYSQVCHGVADDAGAGVRLRDAWRCRAAGAIFSAPAVVAGSGAVVLAGVEGIVQSVSFDGNPLWRCDLSSPIFAPIRMRGSLPVSPMSLITSHAAAVAAAPGATSGAAAGAYPTNCPCPAAAAPIAGPSAEPGAAAGDSSEFLAVAAGAEPGCAAAAAPLALVATQDGGLHCVDARTGRLNWRRALACGNPCGASGAALEAHLGHAVAFRSAHRFSSSVTPDNDPSMSHDVNSCSPAAGGAKGSCAQDAVDLRGARSRAGNDAAAGAAPAPDAVPAPGINTHLALCSTSGAVAVLRCPGACPTSRQPKPLGGAREAGGTPVCESRMIQDVSGNAQVEAAGGTLQPGSLAASQGVHESSPRRVACEGTLGPGSAAGSQGLCEPRPNPGIACRGSLEPGQVPWSQGLHDLTPNPCLGSPSLVAGAQLPAESFSAPVVFDGRMVLGCRDDHLYCLTWT